MHDFLPRPSSLWSNYRPAGRMWPATAFSVTRGTFRKVFKSEIS